MITIDAQLYISTVVGARDLTIKTFEQTEQKRNVYGYYDTKEKGCIYLADVDMSETLRDRIAVHEAAHVKQREDYWFFSYGKDIEATLIAIDQVNKLRGNNDVESYHMSPLECDAELCALYYLWSMCSERTFIADAMDVFEDKHNDIMYGMMIALRNRVSREKELFGQSVIADEFIEALFVIWEETK